MYQLETDPLSRKTRLLLSAGLGVVVGVAQHLLMTTLMYSEVVLTLTSTTTASSGDRL